MPLTSPTPANVPECQDLNLAGLKLVTPQVFRDERGYFFESYNQQAYHSLGIESHFVQDNQSYSVRHTLRGMHFQLSPPQDKLVRVVSGSIYDVCVDLRPGSATFGQWLGVVINAESRQQLFIPAGFAHGFCVLSEAAEVHYKTSQFYMPNAEKSVHAFDEELAIEWPVSRATAIMSGRDAVAPAFSAYNKNGMS